MSNFGFYRCFRVASTIKVAVSVYYRIVSKSNRVMGLTSCMIRMNKRILLIIGSVLLFCLIVYLGYFWKFSNASFTGSVVTSLDRSSLSQSGVEPNCNCTHQSLPSLILTSSSDRQATKTFYEVSKSVLDQRVDHNVYRQDVKVGEDSEYSCMGRSQKFPQAIIIGVRKGGTRALINMLKTHPEIFAARSEIHYFDREENFSKGVQWYIERMPLTSKGQVTIEKSPSYFVVDEVPLRMSMVSQQLKLLLIVRNPIDRLVSDFVQLDSKRLKKNGNRYTLEELVFHSSGEVNKHYSPVSVSMYDTHFQNWLQYFSLEQIHIVDGDALIKNPVPELQKAEKFLGVSTYFRQEMFYFNETKGFYCWKKSGKNGSDKPTCLGDGKGREHPSLSTTTLSKLHNFFSPHNENFFHLCQCQFINW